MYFITKSQWDKIPNDLKREKSITHGGRACFETAINPEATGAPSLIFEGINFTVIPDDYTTGDAKKDEIICQLLDELDNLKGKGNLEQWRLDCMDAFDGQPEMLKFIELAEVYISNRLSEATQK